MIGKLMNNDSRMLVYLSIIALVLSCVVLGYSLIFFGLGPQKPLNGTIISPGVIVVVGLIIAAINGIASSILSGQLEKKLDTLSPVLKVGIPLIIFLATLALTILIALMST
jgi:hypothetical protein